MLADDSDDSVPVEDLPSWTCRLIWDKVTGDPYAMWMNQQLLLDLANRAKLTVDHNYLRPSLVSFKFGKWVDSVLGESGKKACLGGKNVAAFDMRFLNCLPGWDRERFGSRVVDPAMYYRHRGVDLKLPDMAKCIERSGLVWDSSRLHSALWDSRLVIELERRGPIYAKFQGK